MRLLLLILTTLLLSGCGADTSEAPAAASASSAAPTSADESAEAAQLLVEAAPSPVQMGQWTRNCALCHVRGEGGAPVLGDTAAWAERATKGEDVLLAHTLEGFNNMPPLGYCMDCGEEDFLTLIRFMGGER